MGFMTLRQIGCFMRGESVLHARGTLVLCVICCSKCRYLLRLHVDDTEVDIPSIRNMSPKQRWQFHTIERLFRVQTLIQYLTDSMTDLASPGMHLPYLRL